MATPRIQPNQRGDLTMSSCPFSSNGPASPQPDANAASATPEDIVHAERAQLDTEGWTLARPVAGFSLVACNKRSMDTAADADTPAGGSPTGPVQVLQSVFSDGLAHVSVFIEPFDAARHKQPMGTSLGATHTMTHRQGDWWLTVVGEVPMATVQLFEAMFERKR